MKTARLWSEMKSEKEYLYVGHYYDTDGNYILKIGTANDPNRRRKEHNRYYARANAYRMREGCEFEYDCLIPLSKYNTVRYEDSNRKRLQDTNFGEYIRNDRFLCAEKPQEVQITIKKTYIVQL